MKDESLAFQRFINIAEQLMANIESIHSSPSEFGTGITLHQKQIHTIQAIGNNPGINVTRLAEHMKVTKGAVSQIVSKLAAKQLIRKIHLKGNAKEIVLELTILGWTGFNSHERIHKQMFILVRDYLGDDYEPKLETFIKLMTEFIHITDYSGTTVKNKHS
jgi:DNA-binding MarR family transcriptional regulator